MSRAVEAGTRNVPAVVSRYFDAARVHGRPRVRAALLQQEGDFLVRPPRGWRPFTATHHFVVQPAEFVWEARIRAFPGIDIHVRDSLLNGIGSMRASLFGVFTLVSLEGTPEMAAGSLQRYLAEAPWCPAALLPSNGVEWTPIDATSARAMVASGPTRVSLDFHFREDGLIDRIFTVARPRMVGTIAVPTPWQGRFDGYAERGGMLIPTSGEVEWLLPEGPQPYWRGRITAASYS
jgi:hypothetical protein